jgi:hypothetical protein
MSQTSKKWLRRLRPVVAAIIIVAWLVLELVYQSVQPSIEFRIMLLTSLIFMFGESVNDAVDIIRGDSE